jgi:hypothetical protein
MTTPQKPTERESQGFSISDPQAGTIFIGEDVRSPRTRQVEVVSASGGHLKLFKDGGFEIKGQPCDLADNIDSNAVDGLNISSTGSGIRIDAGQGTLTLAAREIRFESTHGEQPFVIRGNQNIIIEAGDSIKLNASNIAIGARSKLLLASKGAIYMRGIGGVTIIEPKSTLIPTNLGDFVDQIISTVVFGGL